MTRFRTRYVSLLAAALLVVPSCGGDDDGGGREASSTTAGADADGAPEDGDSTGTTSPAATDEPTSETTTSDTVGTPDDTSGVESSGPGREEDLALARAAALTLDDLPSGWVMDSEEEDTESFGEDEEGEFATMCPDEWAEVRDILAEGGPPMDVSRSFTVESGMPSVNSGPIVFDDDGLARRAYEMFVSGFAGCMGTALVESITGSTGSGAGEPDMDLVLIDEGGLDGASAFRFTVPFASETGEGTMTLDLAALRSGRVLHLVMAMGAVGGGIDGGEVSEEQLKGIIAAATARTLGA